MKPVLCFALLALALPGSGPILAQDPPNTPSTATQPQPGPAELETKFKEMLTNATLTGRWCSIKDGVLGPEKEDKYSIVGVTKVTGDNWIVKARIQYNNNDIVAPIPVTVKWAGDTPVLIVDKIPVPGSGTYSARVLFYDHTYAGTWSGGEHRGLLKGVIANPKSDNSSQPK